MIERSKEGRSMKKINEEKNEYVLKLFPCFVAGVLVLLSGRMVSIGYHLSSVSAALLESIKTMIHSFYTMPLEGLKQRMQAMKQKFVKIQKKEPVQLSNQGRKKRNNMFIAKKEPEKVVIKQNTTTNSKDQLGQLQELKRQLKELKKNELKEKPFMKQKSKVL